MNVINGRDRIIVKECSCNIATRMPCLNCSDLLFHMAEWCLPFSMLAQSQTRKVRSIIVFSVFKVKSKQHTHISYVFAHYTYSTWQYTVGHPIFYFIFLFMKLNRPRNLIVKFTNSFVSQIGSHLKKYYKTRDWKYWLSLYSVESCPDSAESNWTLPTVTDIKHGCSVKNVYKSKGTGQFIKIFIRDLG